MIVVVAFRRCFISFSARLLLRSFLCFALRSIQFNKKKMKFLIHIRISFYIFVCRFCYFFFSSAIVSLYFFVQLFILQSWNIFRVGLLTVPRTHIRIAPMDLINDFEKKKELLVSRLFYFKHFFFIISKWPKWLWFTTIKRYRSFFFPKRLIGSDWPNNGKKKRSVSLIGCHCLLAANKKKAQSGPNECYIRIYGMHQYPHVHQTSKLNETKC